MSEHQSPALPTVRFGSFPAGSGNPQSPSVTRIGLGGEGVLRTYGEEVAADVVIDTAVKAGITYFDTAPAYSGSQGYLGTYWKSHPGAREGVFHTSKSARRSRDGALADLDETLTTLGTDWLDLWQIHDVRTEEDIRTIEGPGGALEAFIQARDEGRVRRIGVTGHHDPAILTRCVRDWPVQSVLLPVNPVEGSLGGFLTDTVAAARAKGAAVIGMKVFGGGHYLNSKGHVTPELLLRYALSCNIDVAIVGCSLADHVRRLAATVTAKGGFQPMPAEAMAELHEVFAPYARQLAFYRGAF